MNHIFQAPCVFSPKGQTSIDAIEAKMLEQEQAECPVVHRFGPGIYIREVTLPAGAFAVGHYQKRKHMNVVITGRVTMLSEDGSTKEFKAGDVFMGKPGRKMGWIHEDTRWLNIYSTMETDVEKLETWFLEKSQGFMMHQSKEMALAFMAHEDDRRDFRKAVEELGFTEEEVLKQSMNESDQTSFPPGEYKIKISDSPIEGKGLFATASIAKDEVIAPARLPDGKRTPAGRYTNHSVKPNAVMDKGRGGSIILVALEPISGCKGGQNGQEITIDYRKAVKLAREMR